MSKFRLVAPFMIVMLVLTACPAGETDDGNGGGGGSSPGAGGGEPEAGDGTISVTSLWGGAEGDAFQAVEQGDGDVTAVDSPEGAHHAVVLDVLLHLALAADTRGVD